MNRALEAKIQEAQTLPEADQAELAEVMGDFIAAARNATQAEEDMQDPAYRAYVETSLDEAEADFKAGRFTPLRDALTEMKAKFKAEHGL